MGFGFEKTPTTDATCPWVIEFTVVIEETRTYEFKFCAQDEWAHSDAWQQVSPSDPMMGTLFVLCQEWEEENSLALPSFCDYDGTIKESTTDDDETDVTTDDGSATDTTTNE
jgi:hypothetical protein